MDYVSHGIWSYFFFHKIKKPYYAVLFGLLPDTTSWAVYLIYALTTSSLSFGPPNPYQIPDWFFVLYGISHSLIVFVFIAFVVYVVFKKIPLYMLAWPIAIIMDLLTHTREYFSTPFLWPISNWSFPGISWAARWFTITNFSLIVVVFVWIYIKKKRRRTNRH